MSMDAAVTGTYTRRVRKSGLRAASKEEGMKVTQIRNATIRVEFGGKKFLIDPMLADKGAWPGFAGTVGADTPNPTAALPLSIAEILDVDAVIVSHTHADHWDDAAKSLIPKDMPIFAQNEKDAREIEAAGFRDVRALDERTEIDGITIHKTAGRHGSDAVLEGPVGELLGTVSGFVFEHPAEKKLYVAGDTVWCEPVADALARHAPDVVVLNSGDAKLSTDESIIMGSEDVREVLEAASKATIIASHMESVNHATLSRRDLRSFLEDKGMASRVLIPADGESYSF
jgi:L-ascorbate metabolism protein UlaG (beta-lactamase superfamily)